MNEDMNVEDSRVEEALTSLESLPLDELAAYLDPLLERVPEETEPGDTELIQLVDRALNSVRRNSPVLDSTHAQTVRENMPIGREFMNKRRSLDVSRRSLAAFTHVPDGEKKLDLLENEVVPATLLFTGAEFQQLIDDLGSLALFRSGDEPRDDGSMLFARTRARLSEASEDIETLTQDAILRRAEELLLCAAASQQANYWLLRLHARWRWSGTGWSEDYTRLAEDVADLCLDLSVHNCSYLKRAGIGVELDPIVRRVRVPWAFALPSELVDARPSEKTLSAFAVSRALAEFALGEVVERTPILLEQFKLDAEPGHRYLNVFAHELFVPSAALEYELDRREYPMQQEAVLRILEFWHVTGFIAEDRARLFETRGRSLVQRINKLAHEANWPTQVTHLLQGLAIELEHGAAEASNSLRAIFEGATTGTESALANALLNVARVASMAELNGDVWSAVTSRLAPESYDDSRRPLRIKIDSAWQSLSSTLELET